MRNVHKSIYYFGDCIFEKLKFLDLIRCFIQYFLKEVVQMDHLQ